MEHAAAFRALIDLEAAAYQELRYDRDWLYRPDVHGEVSAALVSGMMAPQSPDASRWETLWHYMQGGPGIFEGDLYFFCVDGDLRDRIGKIDTGGCPLYLLTGEYDFSCTPKDTMRTARHIARRGHGDEAARPLPDEREPGAVPPLYPAGARAHSPTGVTGGVQTME